MAKKRTIGKRPIRRNGFIAAENISHNMEREIAAQDAQTQKAINASNEAREALVAKGLFGGLS